MALAGGLCEFMAKLELAYPENSGQPRRAAGSLGFGLGGLFDFRPFVVAARGANAVRNARLGAVGTRDEVRNRHLVVVGSAHVALRPAFSSLGDRHGLLLPMFPF